MLKLANLKQLGKILIIGNTGSGKTYLADKIAQATGFTVLHLDYIFWESKNFKKYREDEEVIPLIDKFTRDHANWVIEGIYDQYAEHLLPLTKYLMFLDMPWETCRDSIQSRTADFNLVDSEQVNDDGKDELVGYAKDYYGDRSWDTRASHLKLCNKFGGEELILTNRNEVNRFLGHLI